MTVARVKLWGTAIGAVNIEPGGAGVFQYDPQFRRSGIEVSPIVMPLGDNPYTFPALNPESFHRLPGLLADSLPDKYGNALIDAWLAGQGRDAESFDAVERLCYVGQRGIGALEFEPAHGPRATRNTDLQISALVELASEVLADRIELDVSMATGKREKAMRDILAVGTSAGGARAKALIAWNPNTGQVRSGQLELDPGFQHWLLKFDGVEENKDRETLADPKGYGAIEVAYSHMARDCDIAMTECRLLEEGGRRHFMTRRFDRDEHGRKRHMQSLAALCHFDFRQAGAHSYEQAFLAIRSLELGHDAAEQQFRRMVFNVVGRNQDDHVKNIAFLMDRSGRWELSPAFDVAYSYNPSGEWTAHHQMSLAGKVSDFTVEDLRQVAEVAHLKRGQAERILAEVTDVVSQWPQYAEREQVDEHHIHRITPTLRLNIPAR